MKKWLISISSFILFTAGLFYLAGFDLFYSIGFVTLLLIHELGHVYALKKLGLANKGVYFFPFVGAVVMHDNKIEKETDHAYLKFFGPFAGAISIIIILLMYCFIREESFLRLAYIGAILNLINMVPITFLDGFGVLRGSIKYVEWVGFLIVLIFGVLIFKEYILTSFFLIIFTLFSDSPYRNANGFQWHEVFIVITLFTTMSFLTIKDTDNLVWNISILAMSLFLFRAYIKDTVINARKPGYKKTIIKLLPLTKKEKIRWVFNWSVLTIFLLSTALLLRP